MDKKFVCQADGRKFATKRALQQHKLASHGTSGQPAASSGKRPPRPMRKASDLGQALFAQPQRVVGAASDSAEISGLDRVLHVESVSKLVHGSVVVDFLVTAGAFKRLSKVAAAFQRVQYRGISFEIEPQMSAATSGGYVVGFVSDPDDAVVNLDQLTATPRSVTTKWWQSAKVVCSIPNRTYFTSQGVELREFSPGRLLLMVDGQATQSGSLTVFCRWSVRLSGAVLESPPPVQKPVEYDLWIRNGHQGLWARVPTSIASDGWSDKADHIVGKQWNAGDAYRLPSPISLVKPNDKMLALHHWVYVRDSDSVFLSVNGPTDWYEAQYEVDNLVVESGSVLHKFAAAKAGERVVGSSSVSETVTPELQSSSELLAEMLKLWKEFLQNSGGSLHRQREPREPSISMESSSSMEFLPRCEQP